MLVSSSGRPAYHSWPQPPPIGSPVWSARPRSTARFQWPTPQGPSRWAHSRRCCVEHLDRPLGVTGDRRGAQARGRGATSRAAQRRQGRGVVGVEQLDVVAAGAEQVEARSASPSVDRRGQVVDLGPEPVGVASDGDGVGVAARSGRRRGRRAPPRPRPRRAGRGRRPAPAGSRTRTASTQPGHHRQRDHRRLVDDDHVVRQPVAAVVAEPVAAAALPSQEPVEGLRRRLADRGARGRRSAVSAQRRADRLLEPGGGLAGRGGQGDPQRTVGLVGEQGEQTRDRGRLAGARAAGEDGGPLPGRRERRRRAARRTPVGKSTGRQAVRASPRRRAGGGRREPRDQVVADLALLAPVAVEVAATSPSTRSTPASASRLAATRSRPAAGRPGQAVGQRFGRRGRRGRGTPTRGAASARSAPGRARPRRPARRRASWIRRAVWTSAASMTPAALKRPSTPVSAEREAPVARVVGLERARSSARPSSRSLRSVTSAAGGDQSKTPATWPSTTGVSGPHMPRRKR